MDASQAQGQGHAGPSRPSGLGPPGRPRSPGHGRRSGNSSATRGGLAADLLRDAGAVPEENGKRRRCTRPTPGRRGARQQHVGDRVAWRVCDVWHVPLSPVHTCPGSQRARRRRGPPSEAGASAVMAPWPDEVEREAGGVWRAASPVGAGRCARSRWRPHRPWSPQVGTETCRPRRGLGASALPSAASKCYKENQDSFHGSSHVCGRRSLERPLRTRARLLRLSSDDWKPEIALSRNPNVGRRLRKHPRGKNVHL